MRMEADIAGVPRGCKPNAIITMQFFQCCYDYIGPVANKESYQQLFNAVRVTV